MKTLTLRKSFVFVVLLVVITIIFTWFAKRSEMDNATESMRLVLELPDVVQFKKAVEENGRSAFNIQIAGTPTSEEPYYLIQIFELFPDHRTTFGWYRYDPKNRKVYRNNIETDSWEEIYR